MATAAAACGGSTEPQVIVVSGAKPASASPEPYTVGASSAAYPSATSAASTGAAPTATASTAPPPDTAAGAGQVPSPDGGAASGVPCDVATMLATNCNACHSDPPLPSALAGLVTYADLTAPSHEMPSENEAQLSLSRMMNAASPMPPGMVLPAADATILQNWINAGYPMGACGSSGSSGSANDAGPGSGSSEAGAPAPASTAAAAGAFANAAPFAAGTSVSGHHNAGQDCMSGCHNHGFSFAGTLYDATGAGVGGAEVRVVDAKGQTFSVYTATGSAQGNFYSKQAFVGPAQVGVRNATSTQDMLVAIQSTAQTPASTGGACNACHCTGGSCTIAAIHLP